MGNASSRNQTTCLAEVYQMVDFIASQLAFFEKVTNTYQKHVVNLMKSGDFSEATIGNQNPIAIS